jgi:hypothetical protein
MADETSSVTKPIITVKEKRKFNWLVLALLLIIVVIGAASLLQIF